MVRRAGGAAARAAGRSAHSRRLEPQHRNRRRQAGQPDQQARTSGYHDRAARWRVHGRGQSGRARRDRARAGPGAARGARGAGRRRDRVGGHRRRHSAFGGREHSQHGMDNGRAGDRDPAGRVPCAVAGDGAIGDDRNCAADFAGLPGPADAVVARRGLCVVALQGVHDHEDFHRGDPVWRRHGFLPVLDFTVQGRARTGTVAGRRQARRRSVGWETHWSAAR